MKSRYLPAGKGLRDLTVKNLEGFLSLFYPFCCYVCDKELPENSEHVCPSCQDNFHFTYFEKYGNNHAAQQLFWGRIPLELVFCLLFYKDENSTKTILNRIKYKGAKELGVYMGKWMGKTIAPIENYQSIEAIIPIPLHDKKAFIRGYNQSLMICKGISEELNIPTVDAIMRRRHHASQTTKNRFERHDNVKDIFDLKKKVKLPYQHVAIVDDVLTTGSTVESAFFTLKHYYPNLKISVLTLALAQ